MTNNPAGLLAVLVYFGAVVVSIPTALAVYALSRRFRVRRVLVYVGLVLAGLALAGGVALAVFVDPLAGATLVGMVVAAAVVLAAFPLYIGRQLLERWTPLGPEDALEFAVLGWPVALVVSFAVFLAPGGPDRYNLTFLSGPVAAVVWTVLGLVVTLGPAVVGLGAYRLFERVG